MIALAPDANAVTPIDAGSTDVAESGTPRTPHGFVSVPMRDGTELRSWIAVPDGAGPFPAFVVRNPYSGLNDAASLEAYSRFFTDRGIVLVWQATRGTGGSGGEFIPFVAEVNDARDTLDFLEAQTFSNGRFAMGGGSYLGYTAFAAAVDDDRVRVVLSDDTASDEHMTRRGGVVNGYLLSWWSFVERGRFADDSERTALTNELDLAELDEHVLGRDLPYWNELLESGLDVYPPDASLRSLAARICVPALHIYEGTSGWRDPLEAWDAIDSQGCSRERPHQWLIVAPESHSTHFSAFGVEDTWITPDMLTMLEAFLLETQPLPTWPRVRYRTSSAGETHSSEAWPPPDVIDQTWFLGPSGRGGEGTLSLSPPESRRWIMSSDPANTDPCDVPTDTWFTSLPLETALTLVGAPRLVVPATTTASDFDIHVSLYDYAPGVEEYRPLGVGSIRARHRSGADDPVPSDIAFSLTVTLTDSAATIPPGHALTIAIAPSQCEFAENPNTREPISRQTRRDAASIAIALGMDGVRLIIPTQ